MLRILLLLALVVACCTATPAQAQMFDEPFQGTPNITTTTTPPAPSAQPTETKSMDVKGEQKPAPTVSAPSTNPQPLLTPQDQIQPGDDTLWGVPNGNR